MTPDRSLGTVRQADDAGRLIASFIGNKDREHFVVVHLSARSAVLSIEIASIGDQTSAIVHPREAFKAAILMNAASIIVGHNHPSGDLTPSPDDRAIYEALIRAGETVGIPVLDFLIVAGPKWHSVVASG
jgi:DNA repair protein RadC